MFICPIWRFPKMVVPQNHLSQWDFPLKTIRFWYPHVQETSIDHYESCINHIRTILILYKHSINIHWPYIHLNIFSMKTPRLVPSCTRFGACCNCSSSSFCSTWLLQSSDWDVAPFMGCVSRRNGLLGVAGIIINYYGSFPENSRCKRTSRSIYPMLLAFCELYPIDTTIHWFQTHLNSGFHSVSWKSHVPRRRG